MRRGKLLLTVIMLTGAVMLSTVSMANAESMWDVYNTYFKKATFVDLSTTISTTTPIWEGFGPLKWEWVNNRKTGKPWTISEHGFRAKRYITVGHNGTHIGPPSHFVENGMSAGEIPVNEMIAPLCVIDITPKLVKEPNHVCTVADIKEWEQKNGKIPEGAFVALRTDQGKDFESNPKRFSRHPFPSWGVESIKFLFEERQILAQGHESMDVDATPTFESQTWIHRHGHWTIECLHNLDQVPATGAIIVVTWPKIKECTGFPARAFAIYMK